MTEQDLIALAATGKCELDVEDDGGESMSADVELDDDGYLSEADKHLSEADDEEESLDAADGDGDADADVGLDDGGGDEMLTGDGDEDQMLTVDADDDEEFEPDDDEDEDEDEQITDESGNAPASLKPRGNDGTLPPVKEGRAGLSSAAAAEKPKPVSLRSADIGRNMKPTVDREKNAIRNVSVMQSGPAMGHGFVIDKKMLEQVRDQMKGGVPMRFTHPQKVGTDGQMEQTDSLGTHVGRVTNVRDAGDELRGDIEFGPHAKHVPMMGDVASYLMDLAEHDPSAFGLSTVFMPDEYERDEMGMPVGRSAGVAACDLTGEPASNRRGLL